MGLRPKLSWQTLAGEAGRPEFGFRSTRSKEQSLVVCACTPERPETGGSPGLPSSKSSSIRASGSVRDSVSKSNVKGQQGV